MLPAARRYKAGPDDVRPRPDGAAEPPGRVPSPTHAPDDPRVGVFTRWIRAVDSCDLAAARPAGRELRALRISIAPLAPRESGVSR